MVRDAAQTVEASRVRAEPLTLARRRAMTCRLTIGRYSIVPPINPASVRSWVRSFVAAMGEIFPYVG